MNQIEWREDGPAMRIVEQMGLQAAVKTVAVQTDIDTRTPNGARAKPIDHELVDEYVSAMREGDAFPHIVLAKSAGKTRLSVVGGNHRLNAAVKIGAREVPAIVVHCTPFEAAMLAKRLNVVNGQRESRTVRILQGIDLITHHGQTIEGAARIAGVTPGVLNNAVRTERLKAKAAELGLPACEKLRATDGHAIGDLINDADIFPELYAYAISANSSAEHLSELCKNLRKTGTLASRLELIRKASAECGVKNVQARVYPVAVQIKRYVNGLTKQLKNRSTLLQLQLSKTDAESLASELQIAVDRLLTATRTN